MAVDFGEIIKQENERLSKMTQEERDKWYEASRKRTEPIMEWLHWCEIQCDLYEIDTRAVEAIERFKD